MKFNFLFLYFFLFLSQLATADDCLEKLVSRFRNNEAAAVSLSRLPTEAGVTMQGTFNRIKAVQIIRNEAYEKKLLRDVPSDMKEAFVKVMDKMHDLEYIGAYYVKLQTDTFESMIRSGKPDLIEKVNKGILDKETMIAVLNERAKIRGVKVNTIDQKLDRKGFNREIGKGYLVDKGFSETSSHGTYTHFLQQDMTYDIIIANTGKSYDDIVKFFKTPQGMKVWDKLYDGFTMNPMSPEFYKQFFMEDNIPLG